MITDFITQKISEALKAHDEIRLSTLRMLSSALNYEFIAKQRPLTSEEEIIVVRREAKKRKDAIEAYNKAGALDRAKKEADELAILAEYLPDEIDDEQLEKIVDEAVKALKPQGLSDMGKVIGYVMKEAAGRADGAKVAALVKSKM